MPQLLKAGQQHQPPDIARSSIRSKSIVLLKIHNPNTEATAAFAAYAARYAHNTPGGYMSRKSTEAIPEGSEEFVGAVRRRSGF